MVLAGFEMNDGKYEATMPVQVGPVVTDWSRDVKLTSKSSLTHLKGSLWSVESAMYLDPKADASKEYGMWGKLQSTKKPLPSYVRLFEMMSPIARKLYMDAILNPDGYVRNILENDLIPNGVVEPDFAGEGNFYARYTWKVDVMNFPDGWFIGEVIGPDGTGNGVTNR